MLTRSLVSGTVENVGVRREEGKEGGVPPYKSVHCYRNGEIVDLIKLYTRAR